MDARVVCRVDGGGCGNVRNALAGHKVKPTLHVAEAKKMPKRQAQGTTRKLIAFEGEAWQAIQALARDQKRTLQDLADEAFADLLRKHGRPVGLLEALRSSLPQSHESSVRPPRKPRRTH